MERLDCASSMIFYGGGVCVIVPRCVGLELPFRALALSLRVPTANSRNVVDLEQICFYLCRPYGRGETLVQTSVACDTSSVRPLRAAPLS